MDREQMDREVERLVRLITNAERRGDRVTVIRTMARLTALFSRFGSTMAMPSFDRALAIVRWW